MAKSGTEPRVRPARSSSSSTGEADLDLPCRLRVRRPGDQGPRRREEDHIVRADSGDGKPTTTVKINKVTITVTAAATTRRRPRRSRRDRGHAGGPRRGACGVRDRLAVAVVHTDLTRADDLPRGAAVPRARSARRCPRASRSAGSSRSTAPAGARRRCRGTGRPRGPHHTRPDRVRAAARVDHRVAEQRRARTRRRHHPATVVHREQRLEERGCP